MDIRNVSDDLFEIGCIAILNKTTGNSSYDFNFRNNFECNSIIHGTDLPILLHIGAVEDYAALEEEIESMGMSLLVHEKEHLHCSTIEKWYPSLKDITPYTEIYDEFPDLEVVLQNFSFPFFVKGNRQTNRHNKSKCIINSAEEYQNLKDEWKRDSILSWQKIAIREYVQLAVVDDVSFPEMVPISYEFRFFFLEGECIGYGPYWTQGKRYELNSEDEKDALEIATKAADKMRVTFLAVDIAKRASGEWIVIEVNDAQESGFVGINPISLWNATIDKAQNLNWISVENLFSDGEGAYVMGSDPFPNISIEEMRQLVKDIASEHELATAFANASNKWSWVEDDIYDYEKGTPEYNKAKEMADSWLDIEEELLERIWKILRSEGVTIPDKGYIRVLEPFMKRNGFRDGRGWWVLDD